MATPFHVFCPRHTAPYPASRMAEIGKSASVDLSSCRHTTSGEASANQASRFESLRLTLLILKVATLRLPVRLWDPVRAMVVSEPRTADEFGQPSGHLYPGLGHCAVGGRDFGDFPTIVCGRWERLGRL